MGQVFRARDTRLGREVALKLLPDSLARDPEKLARLEREAQLLAALNHPNIATLHGLEECDGLRFLVMELVPGETLDDRLSGGPPGLEEGLSLLRQIAEALEAAHEKGIIHRDLKPANVKVTSEGRVKLLDFGLAKAVADETPPVHSQSPTLTRGGIEHGAVVGTTWYMSPEQARGRALDRRTDIWSFGCVFYEVVTGRKAFQGETVSDIIASILLKEPDWTKIPRDTPVKVRDLLRRCLQKEPHRRLRDIGDARLEIEESLTEPSGDRPPSTSRSALVSILIAAAAALAAGFVVWSTMRSEPERRSVSRFALELAPEEALTHLNDPVVAWSRDGSRIVYVGGDPTRLYVRPIDQIGATPIPGTEDAITAFLSPDGLWAGFYGRGKLEKISLGGGVPVPLCEVQNGWGASWGDGETILFSPTATSGLSRVSASGGSPSVVTTPDANRGEVSHRWPEFLPGGRAALFTIWTGSSQNARIALLSLETGEQRVLLEGTSFARYSATGHIVYARDGRLGAVPFDLEKLEVTGPPIPISLALMTQPEVGTAHFALSGDGSLAYVPGAGPPGRTLMWVDRDGSTRNLEAPRRAYEHPRLSPDGKRVAVTITDEPTHVWTYDLERDTLSRLTAPEGRQPVWTPDGESITFRSGPFDIVEQASDGSSGRVAGRSYSRSRVRANRAPGLPTESI
jgi:serine/threonine-protein kinase